MYLPIKNFPDFVPGAFFELSGGKSEERIDSCPHSKRQSATYQSSRRSLNVVTVNSSRHVDNALVPPVAISEHSRVQRSCACASDPHTDSVACCTIV